MILCHRTIYPKFTGLNITTTHDTAKTRPSGPGKAIPPKGKGDFFKASPASSDKASLIKTDSMVEHTRLTPDIRPYLLRLCKSLNSFLVLKFEQVSSVQRKKGDFLSLLIISFADLIQSPQLVLPGIMPFGSKYLQFPHLCFILGIRSKPLPFVF